MSMFRAWRERESRKAARAAREAAAQEAVRVEEQEVRDVRSSRRPSHALALYLWRSLSDPDLSSSTESPASFLHGSAKQPLNPQSEESED